MFRAHLFGIKIIEVLEEQLLKDNFARPYKQFVFGSLTFKTDNALPNKNGVRQITWHAHVAPVIRLKGNPSNYYILDPGMSGKPILRDAWYQMMIQNRDTTTGQRNKWAKPANFITGKVTCKPDTLYWNNDCFDPNLETDHLDYDKEIDDETFKLLSEYAFL